MASRDGAILAVFGGACHNECSWLDYGAKVQDLADLALLHLPSLTWLPPSAEPYQALRGGTNALIDVPEGPGRRRVLVLGGMNSEPGALVPSFLDEGAEIVGLDVAH